MMKTRAITATGFGAKTDIGVRDRARRARSAKVEIKEIRESWATLANERLVDQGLEISIDHRSREACGGVQR
jgi:hypothetical protein